MCLEEGSEKKVSGSEKFFEVNLLAQYMRHTHHLQAPTPLSSSSPREPPEYSFYYDDSSDDDNFVVD